MTDSLNDQNRSSEVLPSSSSLPSPNASLASNEETHAQLVKSKRTRSRTLIGFTILLLMLGLVWFCYWYFYLQYHESTDDAYANGNLINLNSVISGAVIAFYADNTNLVKEGQLLVELDPTSYQAIYNKELATLASTTLHVRQLYDDVRTSRANLENKFPDLARTKFDYNSRSQLHQVNPQAVSQEDFVHSQQDYLSAQSSIQGAESQLEAALAVAGNTQPENHPLIEQQKENIRIAYYNLKHCSIYAPQTGYVAQRAVDVGQWITPTTNLMAIIPTDYVWVDANFKETQLGNMRIGQPATVWFDLYGSKVQYQGKVIGIASGTGSVFSLIPPQNATGNWIKIVQRLPVRISLDRATTEKFPIRVGISAEVDVDITNQNLPLLAQSPPDKFVNKTNVFDIHMEEVNQIMENIIRSNLKQEQRS